MNPFLQKIEKFLITLNLLKTVLLQMNKVY
nr:MAG TPA: hypothetical protein [Bacteriophage sp.]